MSEKLTAVKNDFNVFIVVGLGYVFMASSFSGGQPYAILAYEIPQNFSSKRFKAVFFNLLLRPASRNYRRRCDSYFSGVAEKARKSSTSSCAMYGQSSANQFTVTCFEGC